MMMGYDLIRDGYQAIHMDDDLRSQEIICETIPKIHMHRWELQKACNDPQAATNGLGGPWLRRISFSLRSTYLMTTNDLSFCLPHPGSLM
jgi:hypothetical protein